jgi:hypothetical protein
MIRLALLAAAVLTFSPVLAGSPEDFLAAYAVQARAADSRFKGFSAERGKALYFRKHDTDDGELSCASCHREDPRQGIYGHQDRRIPCRMCHHFYDLRVDGTPRWKRHIPALAPSANPDRYTDPVLVEKWLGHNCRFLLSRACTPLEKGDVLTWLLTVK